MRSCGGWAVASCRVSEQAVEQLLRSGCLNTSRHHTTCSCCYIPRVDSLRAPSHTTMPAHMLNNSRNRENYLQVTNIKWCRIGILVWIRAASFWTLRSLGLCESSNACVTDGRWDFLGFWRIKNPTRCHLLFYCTSYRLNMFRALQCPSSSGARDCNVDYHIGRFVLGLLYYYIVLLIGSTCIGHYYDHHQEVTTIMLITTLVVSFLVCCIIILCFL